MALGQDWALALSGLSFKADLRLVLKVMLFWREEEGNTGRIYDAPCPGI